MAPISRTTGYTTALAPAPVREQTLSWFAAVSHTVVTVTADDAVGFGVKTGIKGKYEQWLGEIADGLRAAAT